MRRTGLVSAIALIAFVNVITLFGVYRNRHREPVRTIELTERELPLQILDRENSGIDLRIAWTYQFTRQPEPELDRPTLEGAGFDLRIPPGVPARDIALMPRVACVVFEYGGPVWQEQAAKSEAEKGSPRPADKSAPVRPAPFDPAAGSRLVVVDASDDLSTLRNRYPDQSRYLIVKAVVAARIEDVTDPGTGRIVSHKFTGHVSQVLPSFVHVPLPYSRLLSPLKPQEGYEPRYAVTLKYGPRLEPWVSSVRLLK